MAVLGYETAQVRLRVPAERAGVVVMLGLGLLASLSAWFGADQPILAVDDGYVHLALAQQLRAGGWGLAGDPVAAGSSSILWPWLLAPFADGGPAGVIWAQALACLALGAAQGLGARLLFEAGWLRLPATLATGLVLLCAGGPTHAAAGMEHAAHAAATFAGLLALLRLWRGQPAGWPLLALAASAPLWRYEGLALFALLMAGLVLTRRPVAALLLAAGAGAMAGANAAVALAHGAPALPVSLLDRGALAGGPDPGGLFADPWAAPLLGAGLALAFATLATRSPLALAGLALVIAHALAGEVGERGRLDFYATSGGWLAALAAATPLVVGLRRRREIAAVGALALAALCKSHLAAVLETPLAARDLARTAGAARLIVDAYGGPAGADGLGLMAYGARHRVIDLVGWARPEPRTALREGRWQSWADEAMTRAGAGVAVLSAAQAPSVPPGWRLAGTLDIEGPQRSSSAGPLNLWATGPAPCARLAAAAAQARPEGAIWRAAPGCAGPSSPVHQ